MFFYTEGNNFTFLSKISYEITICDVIVEDNNVHDANLVS